jgi:hypothetical protein
MYNAASIPRRARDPRSRELLEFAADERTEGLFVGCSFITEEMERKLP